MASVDENPSKKFIFKLKRETYQKAKIALNLYFMASRVEIQLS